MLSYSYCTDHFMELLMDALEGKGQPSEKAGIKAYFLPVASVNVNFLPLLVLVSYYRTSTVKYGELVEFPLLSPKKILSQHLQCLCEASFPRNLGGASPPSHC